VVVGVGLLAISTLVGDPSGTPSGDVAEAMVSSLRSAGQAASGTLLELAGSALAVVGVVGFFLTFGRERKDADPIVVSGLEGAPPSPAAPPLPTAPPTDQWTDEIDFDPTLWEHPAGAIFVVQGGSAGPLYEAVRGVAAVHTVGSGLLVAMLQGLNDRERKLVVVLGAAKHVETFGLCWTASGAEAQPSPDYEALRAEIAAAGYMVLTAARV